MGIALISECEVFTMEKLERLEFSREELCEALQGYASKLGEFIDVRAVRTISFDEADEDFCDLEVESLRGGVTWETYSLDLIGAALLNYCRYKDIELPAESMGVVISKDGALFLEFMD